MKCSSCFISFCVWICVGLTDAQYAPLHQVTNSECEGSNKAYLVERFFNVIFSEFQNTPPVCVCAQMCPDQPTYCYPNGCMRLMEHKRFADEGGAHTSKHTAKEGVNSLIYIIDGKGENFLNDLAGNIGDGGKAKGHIITGLPDILKERVKILFKYKKLPKVEMRYNLKEHVRHMNLDKQRIDLNFIRKNSNGENTPVTSFRSKAVRPRFTSDLNFKKMGSSPFTAFLLNDIHKNTFNKRDLKKNLEELEKLKTAVLLKQSIVPGVDDTPVLVYSIIDDLINATALKEIIENEEIVTLDSENDVRGENNGVNEGANTGKAVNTEIELAKES